MRRAIYGAPLVRPGSTLPCARSPAGGTGAPAFACDMRFSDRRSIGKSSSIGLMPRAAPPPQLFGVAHVHHFFERRRQHGWEQALVSVLVQFTYTYLFGLFSAFLLARTAHLSAPMVRRTGSADYGARLPSCDPRHLCMNKGRRQMSTIRAFAAFAVPFPCLGLPRVLQLLAAPGRRILALLRGPTLVPLPPQDPAAPRLLHGHRPLRALHRPAHKPCSVRRLPRALAVCCRCFVMFGFPFLSLNKTWPISDKRQRYGSVGIWLSGNGCRRAIRTAAESTNHRGESAENQLPLLVKR